MQREEDVSRKRVRAQKNKTSSHVRNLARGQDFIAKTRRKLIIQQSHVLERQRTLKKARKQADKNQYALVLKSLLKSVEEGQKDLKKCEELVERLHKESKSVKATQSELEEHIFEDCEKLRLTLFKYEAARCVMDPGMDVPPRIRLADEPIGGESEASVFGNWLPKVVKE